MDRHPDHTRSTLSVLPGKDGLLVGGGRNSLAKEALSHREASFYVPITLWPLLSFLQDISTGIYNPEERF